MLRGVISISLLSFMVGCGRDAVGPSTAQPSFAGTSLRLSIEQGSPLSEALRLRVPEWEARTGAKVTVTEDAVVDGEADMAACTGTALAELPARKFLSAEFKRKADVGFVNIPYLHQTAFGARSGEPIAIPLAVEQLLLWYRADLFADARLQESYSSQFKQRLAPPKTWDEYVRVAKFFLDSKAVKYGCVEAFNPDAAGLHGFFARAASFSEDPRSTPFDVADGRSRLGDPEYAKAADNLVTSLACSPASGGKYVSEAEARKTFATGDAAMILVASPPTSHPSLKVAAGFNDKLGVAPLPASPLVYSAKSKAWRDRNLKNEEIPAAPYFASTGHYLSLSDKSSGTAAAENLLIFLSSATDNAYLVQGARMGLTPAREELLNDSGRFAGGFGLSVKLTADYFTLVREGLRPKRWSSDLRVEKSAGFLKSLFQELRLAASGSKTTTDALAVAHDAWRIELDKRGETFVEEFRMSQGFSPRMK